MKSSSEEHEDILGTLLELWELLEALLQLPGTPFSSGSHANVVEAAAKTCRLEMARPDAATLGSAASHHADVTRRSEALSTELGKQVGMCSCALQPCAFQPS